MRPPWVRAARPPPGRRLARSPGRCPVAPGGEHRHDHGDALAGPVIERVAGEDRGPRPLGHRPPKLRLGEIAGDMGPQLGAGRERRDAVIELFGDLVEVVGQDERAAGRRVVQAVRHEAPARHVGPVVVEDDVGRGVVRGEAIVRDVVAAVVPRVQHIRRPAMAVDREVAQGGRQLVGRRSARRPATTRSWCSGPPGVGWKRSASVAWWRTWTGLSVRVRRWSAKRSEATKTTSCRSMWRSVTIAGWLMIHRALSWSG